MKTVFAIVITAGICIPLAFLAGSLHYRSDRTSQAQQIGDLQVQLSEKTDLLNKTMDDYEEMADMWENTHNALTALQHPNASTTLLAGTAEDIAAAFILSGYNSEFCQIVHIHRSALTSMQTPADLEHCIAIIMRLNDQMSDLYSSVKRLNIPQTKPLQDAYKMFLLAMERESQFQQNSVAQMKHSTEASRTAVFDSAEKAREIIDFSNLTFAKLIGELSTDVIVAYTVVLPEK